MNKAKKAAGQTLYAQETFDLDPAFIIPTRSPRVLAKIFRKLPAVLNELTENEVRIIWSLVSLAYYRLLRKQKNGRNTSAKA